MAPALLKAIAEKLIPGIPEETRISILQQTNAQVSETDIFPQDAASSQTQSELQGPGCCVLEEVIEKATARSNIEQEIRGGHLLYCRPQ